MKIQEAKRKKQYEINEQQNVEEVEPIDISTLEEEIANCNAQLEKLEDQQQTGSVVLENSKSTLTDALQKYVSSKTCFKPVHLYDTSVFSFTFFNVLVSWFSSSLFVPFGL